MSKEVEQRVVEMRFDNKQFESATATTMSTLDKLKQKLNFTSASKGFENIGVAAKKVDMTGLGKAVESVQVKFSALEVMGVTALANITNSAVNAGKRIISALTIDPIKTGFQEYETQINAVQTILANTQSKGSTLADVNAALDELNKYADMTIYNFTEMTRNIGTFTAAGVELDKSVSAIKGIANLAAVSGSTSQQASTAMYQLSQALAAGKVQLMDWNSVVNAGMGGELFQTALKRTATQMGENVDALIEKYGSFRESLTKGGWLTAEVLTETLTQLSGAYSEADLIAQGYSEKQAKEITQLAQTAVDAATKVKTFTQLWDTLKEAAQSGWTETWEIIIGDFEEAKEFLTGLSDYFGAIIGQSAEARNNLLEEALGSRWTQLTDKINEAGIATEDFNTELEKTVKAHGYSVDELIKKHGSLAKAFTSGALSSNIIVETLKRMAGVSKDNAKVTADMTDKLEYFNTVVGKVVKGDFGNGAERIEALTKAGYDQIAVQKLVNYVWERNGKNWSNTAITADELGKVIGELSVQQLTSIGYTKEEANALKNLAKQAEETGTPINELIASLTKPSGRELLLDSVTNLIHSIVDSASAVRKAWQEIFPPMESTQLYNIIAGIHSLTESLEITDEKADKITRTFKGLFAILDIISTILGGGFKLAFKVLTTVLDAFDMDLLDFTAHLGDAVVGLRDFLLDNELVTKGFEALATGLISGVKAIKQWIDVLMDLPMVQTAITNLKNGLSNLKEVGLNAIEGFQNGLKEGLYSIPELVVQIGKTLLQAIKDVLGIHSPSTEMYSVGQNVVQGLVNGIRGGLTTLVEVLKEIGSMIVDFLGGIDWNYLLSIALSAAMFGILWKFASAIEAITSPLDGVSNLLDDFADGITRVSKALSFQMRAEAIKSIAVSLALLAGSVFLLAQLDTGKLLGAIAALTALAGVIVLLSVAIGKFGPKETLKFVGFGTAVVGVATSLLIAAVALKKLESLEPERLNQTLISFGAIATTLVAVLATYGMLVKGEAAKNINKLGTMMLKLSISLMLMVAAVKLISTLSADEIKQGGVAIGAFTVVVGLLGVVSGLSGGAASSLGSMMIKLSAALILMVAAVKLISTLSADEIKQGGVAIGAFIIVVGLLSAITKVLGPADITKLGSTLLAMSTSMLIMAGVVRILAGMSLDDIAKGELAILGFTAILTILVTSLKGFGSEVPKITLTLIAMSTAIGILAGVAVVLSLLDISGLAKGITAVGILSAFMAGLTYVTKYAQNVTGSLVAMSVAIGVMAASVAALSFIDPTKLAGATAALGVLMGMFAVVVKSSANVQGSLGTLIVMTTAIGLLAGIIYILSDLPIDSVLSTAASLSLLLLSLSASMLILSKAGAVAPTTMVALGAMTLAIAGLATILGVLDYMNVEPSIETATALSVLLTALSGVCVILAAVGKIGAGAALQGALALDGVIAIIGGLMVGIGALVSYFPQMEEFASKGAYLLEAVGRGIGGFVGGIAGGVLSGVTSGLPDVADNLSDFMEKLTPFIAGAKSIDAESVNAIKSIAEMILILTASNIINGIASFFGGGNSSLTNFVDQLQPFGEAMAQFSEAIKGRVDAESLNAVSNAGKMLAELNNSIPRQGGALQDFLGSKNLGTFGEQLASFGEAIVSFSETVAPGGSLKVNAEAVEAAANAGKVIADLNTSLPRQGGVLQDFLGSQDLGVFSQQMKQFGEAIVSFSETVAPGGSIKVNAEAVEAAANAGRVIAELNTSLPKQGGVLQDFLGSQDLGVFGTQLKAFGTAIVDFSRTVSADGAINADAIETTKNAASMMVELNNTLPAQGGVLSTWFNGTQDMATFGSQLVAFGQYFAQYSGYIENVKPEVVSTTANAAQSLVALSNSLPETKFFGGETTLDEFGSQLSKFGGYFAEYYSQISGVNVYKITAVADGMSSLVRMAKGMESVNSDAMASFGKNLKKLGNYGVDGFLEAFDGASTKVSKAATDMLTAFINAVDAKKTDLVTVFQTILNDAGNAINKKQVEFSTAGEEIVSAFNTGVQTKAITVITLFSDMATKASTAIRSQYPSFYSAGIYLVDGFASGIRSNSQKAQAEARKLAEKVTSITKSALQINSPSRVFYDIGRYVVDGLSNGIIKETTVVTKAAAKIGTTIVEATKSTLGIHSPSSVMRDEVGRYVVQGISEGIEADMSAEEAAAKKAQNITDAFQEEFDRLDVADETSQLESQLFDRNEDYVAKYERQLKRAELALGEYQSTLEVFGESAIETQRAYNKYLQEEIDLRELAATKAKEAYDRSLEWIESQKNADNLSLIEELAAWKRVQSRYLSGTEERIKADEEILRLQNELKDATESYYDELNTLQEESNSKRIQLDRDYEEQTRAVREASEEKRIQLDQDYEDQSLEIREKAEASRLQIDQDYADQKEEVQTEYNEKRLQLEQEYADKTQSINEQLIKDIESVEKAYEDAVNSRSETLYNAYDLFDSVEEGEEVSGDTLIQNLQGQIDAFEEWSKNINSLSIKGLDSELIDELREMGPASAEEIKALNEMSSEQLDEYIALWRSKHQLAKDQAIYELEDMRLETNSTIEQMREDARVELEEYRTTWLEEMQTLSDETNQKLDNLKTDWVNKVSDLNNETDAKLTALKVKWLSDIDELDRETSNSLDDLKANWLDDIDKLDRETDEKLTNLKNSWMETVVGLKTETESEFSKMTSKVINTLGEQTKWTETGANMIEGVLTGVIEHTPELVAGVEYAMEQALKAARETLGINSPSKEFAKMGRYSDEGFASGLKNYSNLVMNSAKEIGKSALVSINNSVRKIADALDGNLDVQPTIRPVLDLSDIKDGTNRLNTLFSRDQSMAISTSMNHTPSFEPQSTKTTPSSKTVFQFTQNNYSPKALSRTEIYRQTKNQFSAFERTVKA